MSTRPWIAVALVVAATLYLAGCGGSSTSSRSSVSARRPSPSSSPSPARPNEIGTTDSFKFVPDHLTVAAGTTVTWRESTKYTPHDVRLDGDPENVAHDLKTLDQTWSFTFTHPGTYAFVCTLHAPDMKGQVTVTPSQ